MNPTRFVLIAVVTMLLLGTSSSALRAAETLHPIPMTSLEVNGFWQVQFKRLTEKWLPHCIKEMEEGGRGQELLNLVYTAKVLQGEPHGKYTGAPWSDAYVYNTMEAMCLALMIDPAGDEELAQAQAFLRDTMEKWIPIILAAQMDSGYIHSFHTVNGRPHFTQIGDHEFYVMGYFLEMGVAHYRLTQGQDRRLYDAAIRVADHLDSVFGPSPQRTWKNGHPGLEYALCRLGRLVNEVEGPGQGDKYVQLAKHFLDHQHEIEPDPYNQSERPAVEMSDATGHAVRATYFYTAMADMALLTDDPKYQEAVDRLWASAIQRKHYLTGGVGASDRGEAFSTDFDLRNDGYCESCASCGMGFWADRMSRLHHAGHYHDVFERLLYNNLLGSIEQTGENFYYQNPLASDGARYPWHGCPCCVGNIPRTLLMVKDLMYETNDQRDTLFVNHFVDSAGTITNLAGTELRVRQTTEYPWQGKIKLELSPAKPVALTLKLRVPDRTESDLYTATPDLTGKFELRVNGEAVAAEVQDGYVSLQRTWKDGDAVELDLPLEVQRIHCDERVEANRGRVAVLRGPLVYSFESIDQTADVRELALKPDSELKAVWKPDLLEGVMAVEGEAVLRDSPDQKVNLLGVPNYARLNRGGYSQVWMLEEGAPMSP